MNQMTHTHVFPVFYDLTNRENGLSLDRDLMHEDRELDSERRMKIVLEHSWLGIKSILMISSPNGSIINRNLSILKSGRIPHYNTPAKWTVIRILKFPGSEIIIRFIKSEKLPALPINIIYFPQKGSIYFEHSHKLSSLFEEAITDSSLISVHSPHSVGNFLNIVVSNTTVKLCNFFRKICSCTSHQHWKNRIDHPLTRPPCFAYHQKY